MSKTIYFAIPGNIDTRTGGYAYDRRLLAELQHLGFEMRHLALSARFPNPDDAALQQAQEAFAALPDGSIVLADGLAFGVMDTIAECHAQRLQIVALCHHPLFLEAGLTAQEAQRLHASEKRALHAARAIIVTSAMTRQTLTEEFSIAESKTSVALPGTDRHGESIDGEFVQLFAPCRGKPPVLLCVATLTRRKAHDVLIAALARIAALPWTARFVGGDEFDPQWAAQLRAQASTLGLAERITFTGSVPDPGPEYMAADVFVLPSLFEGYGMVFAEALVCGLPVVAARAGAVPDVVPTDAGILVAPSDAEALAGALHRLLSNDTLRRNLQQGAQRAARRLPAWEDSARIVADLINRLP